MKESNFSIYNRSKFPIKLVKGFAVANYEKLYSFKVAGDAVTLCFKIYPYSSVNKDV